MNRAINRSFLDYLARATSILLGGAILGMFGGVPWFCLWTLYQEPESPSWFKGVYLVVAVIFSIIAILITKMWFKQDHRMWKDPANWEQ